MSDPQKPRHPRRTTAIIIGVLVIVIAAVTGVALVTAGATKPTQSATPGVSEGGAPIVTTSPTPSSSAASPTSSPTSFTPTPAATASTPQPTQTATISSAAPIRKALTAEVVKMQAVQGTASAPGEIAGPSVRFTITITNTTGKRFDLSTTVVNAYYGSNGTPAVSLAQPGAKAFPSSVANGSTATGVFVFNIPKGDRGHVEVTVDTSVLNPVVAFKGSAPTS